MDLEKSIKKFIDNITQDDTSRTTEAAREKGLKLSQIGAITENIIKDSFAKTEKVNNDSAYIHHLFDMGRVNTNSSAMWGAGPTSLAAAEEEKAEKAAQAKNLTQKHLNSSSTFRKIEATPEKAYSDILSTMQTPYYQTLNRQTLTRNPASSLPSLPISSSDSRGEGGTPPVLDGFSAAQKSDFLKDKDITTPQSDIQLDPIHQPGQNSVQGLPWQKNTPQPFSSSPAARRGLPSQRFGLSGSSPNTLTDAELRDLLNSASSQPDSSYSPLSGASFGGGGGGFLPSTGMASGSMEKGNLGKYGGHVSSGAVAPGSTAGAKGTPSPASAAGRGARPLIPPIAPGGGDKKKDKNKRPLIIDKDLDNPSESRGNRLILGE